MDIQEEKNNLRAEKYFKKLESRQEQGMLKFLIRKGGITGFIFIILLTIMNIFILGLDNISEKTLSERFLNYQYLNEMLLFGLIFGLLSGMRQWNTNKKMYNSILEHRKNIEETEAEV